MEFKYSEEFASELRAAVAKPGLRMFLSEALSELEQELGRRPARFLRGLQSGQAAMVPMESKGQAQVARGESRGGAPRFLIRFMGAPAYVLVATCDQGVYWNEGEARQLAFTAVVEIAEQMAKASNVGRSADAPSRM